MHTSKDSMWRKILKIFGFLGGSKQGPGVWKVFGWWGVWILIGKQITESVRKQRDKFIKPN